MTAVMHDQASWFTEDGDTQYLGKVLRHQPMELSLDDRVPAWLVFLMWLRAALFGTIADFIGAYVWYRQNANNTYNGLPQSGPPAGYFVLPGVIVFFLVFFLAKLSQPVGEWRVLLASRSHCADSVYSMIAGVIAQRRIPLRVKPSRRMNDAGSGTWASRLIIQEGSYTAYVTVFPYGTSLYLSWSMWRRRSGWVLFWRMVGDMFGANILKVMLRMDRPRAMREAVHSACREGLKVAVTNTMVPVDFGFKNGLPPIEAFSGNAQNQTQAPPVPQIPVIPTLPPPPTGQVPQPVQAAPAGPMGSGTYQLPLANFVPPIPVAPTVVEAAPEPVFEPALEPIFESVPEPAVQHEPRLEAQSDAVPVAQPVPSLYETAGSDGTAA